MQLGMMGQRHALWLAVWAASLALAACGGGDDDHGDDGGTGSAMCAVVQNIQTCSCGSDQHEAYRECKADHTWGACMCRDAGPNQCDYLGQPVKCDPCPGEAEGRMTTCLQGGTFDCSCQTGGGGSGGAPGMDVDAG